MGMTSKQRRRRKERKARASRFQGNGAVKPQEVVRHKAPELSKQQRLLQTMQEVSVPTVSPSAKGVKPVLKTVQPVPKKAPSTAPASNVGVRPLPEVKNAAKPATAMSSSSRPAASAPASKLPDFITKPVKRVRVATAGNKLPR